jgi:hypothetical protein
LRSTISVAVAATAALTSQLTTSAAPARAAIRARRPDPAPMSSTRQPGTTLRRKAASKAELRAHHDDLDDHERHRTPVDLLGRDLLDQFLGDLVGVVLSGATLRR